MYTNLGGHPFGAEKDPAAALSWLIRAAEAGVPQAMTALGEFHAGLRGENPDSEQAILWLTRAAERGEQRTAELLAAQTRDQQK